MKASIFYRNDHTNKDGSRGIYLRVIIDRKKKDYSLKISVLPEFWDAKELRVKRKHPDSIKYNLVIETQLKKAKDILLDYQINQKQLNFDEFEFNFTKVQNKHSFYEFVSVYIEEKDLEKRSSETLRSYNSYLSKLKEYKPDMTFSEVNSMEFSKNYEKFMRYKRGNNVNTLYKNMSFIKTVLTAAQERGLIQDVVFSFDIKKKQGSREYLTSHELEKLESLLEDKRLKNYQLKTLSYFLFACYTGLRYTDLKTLKYSEIVEKEIKVGNSLETRQFVRKLMHKTENSSGLIVEIPLITKAKKLIGTGLPEENIFTVNSNQVSNRYAKELMDLAGITKKISMHCARHTFATHSLNLGMPKEVVQSLLGHSEIRTTEIYAKIVDSSKVLGMDKWEK